MTASINNNVDYRLLNKLSDLVICSSCLRSGTVTPVPQVFSKRHKPNNVCAKCRAERRQGKSRVAFGKILQFRA